MYFKYYHLLITFIIIDEYLNFLIFLNLKSYFIAFAILINHFISSFSDLAFLIKVKFLFLLDQELNFLLINHLSTLKLIYLFLIFIHFIINHCFLYYFLHFHLIYEKLHCLNQHYYLFHIVYLFLLLLLQIL